MRCFTTPARDDERHARYQAIAARLAGLPDVFVPFRYHEQGIRVLGRWYPIVAMRWASGETLGRFVETHAQDASALRALARSLGDLLTQLEAQGIAHGDWQHDNLLVSDNGRRVTLVDYDGVYVPELEGGVSPEIGHANYQHPQRTSAHFGVGLDRFAHLVMQTALLALCRDPALWSRYSDGESLLFKRADFDRPHSSPVFRAVAALSANDVVLAESLARLELACASGPTEVLPAPVSIPVTPEPAVSNGAKKWWQTAETVTRPQPAPIQQAESGAGYISRLFNPEALRAEQKSLWWGRLSLLSFIVWIAVIVVLLYDGGTSFVLLANAYWVLRLLGSPYGLWPRKKIQKELKAEIEKLEKLEKERHEKVYWHKEQNGHLLGGNASAFIHNQLEKISIGRILSIHGVSEVSLDRLRMGHINTAADLRQCVINQGGIPSHEWTAMQNWLRELEMSAADEYRRQGMPKVAAPVVGNPEQVRAEIERLEREIAAFEQELAKLREEEQNFPDVSARAYFRKLFFVKEPAQP